jgi:hypothetical protein
MKRVKCVLYGLAVLLCVAAMSPAVVAPASARAFDQPQMQAARVDLNKARAELRAATADKGGHRTKALEYVNSAINEVAAGIRFDRRHDDESAGALAFVNASADQPRMQAALDALRSARGHLEAATADKGGHRANAISLVDKAIDEVQKGIEYDRTH